MSTKMKKGIFKPLRCITHMFDAKEPEMQIGFPTDVKHVAHIGWDGPNVNAPTWMKEYHSAPLTATQFGSEGKESPTPNLWGSQDFSGQGGFEESPTPSQETVPPSKSSETPADAPTRAPNSSRPRHTRRHQSEGTASADTPSSEPVDGSRRGRRVRKKEASGGPDGSPQSSPGIPRQSRRRSKGTSESGGSTRSSRLKDSSRAPDAGAKEESGTPQSPSKPAAAETSEGGL